MATYTIDRDLNIEYYSQGRSRHLGKVDIRELAKNAGVPVKQARDVAVNEAEDWASREAGPWSIIVSPNGTFVVQDIPWSIS